MATVKTSISIQKSLREIRNRELLEKINQAYSEEPDHQEKGLADRTKSYHLRHVLESQEVKSNQTG